MWKFKKQKQNIETGEMKRKNFCFLMKGSKVLSSDETVIKQTKKALTCEPRTQKDFYDSIIELIGGEAGIAQQSKEVMEALAKLKESIDANLHSAKCIEEHFYFRFKNNGGIEALTQVLQNCKTPKDYAKLACQIFNSKHFIKKNTVFMNWYRTFCEKVGCVFCGDYKPSKLKLKVDEERYYAFLHI